MIFDSNAEPENAAGAFVVTGQAELIDLVAGSKGPIKICWRGFEHQGREAFDWGCRVAWAAGNLLVVWEEVDRWLGPAAGRRDSAAAKIINAGRHRDLGVWGAARRPAAVPRDLTANANRICAFRSFEPRDLAYLREFVGQAADQLPDLAPYTALDWQAGAGAGVKMSPFS